MVLLQVVLLTLILPVVVEMAVVVVKAYQLLLHTLVEEKM
jgi:hypothetical protein